jgi:hypothetical protein
MSHRIAVGAVVVAALAFAAPAGAAVTASTVTSPAAGAAFDFDADAPGRVVVTGTATADDPANDKLRIACTYGENTDGTAGALAPATATGALTPTGPHTGTFSVEISPTDFDYYTCRLRAVPSTLPADYRPFNGAVAHFSGHRTYPAGGPAGLKDYYQDVSGPLGYWDGNSTDCFIGSTYTLDPASLGFGDLFGCAAIAGADPAGTRAALRIDGRDAFLPGEAYWAYGAITGAAPITGFTRKLDPATGDAAFGAALPTLRCANDAAAYPPACPAWAQAGLRDDAVTVGDHGGRLARHTDVWRNPGTAARELDVWYRIATAHASAQWRFPGEAAFKGHVGGDTIPAPAAGPGSALVADDPGQTGYQHPRGSLTWSSAPSELRFTGPDTLYLHYVRTIAAGGAVPISLAFATDASQANADALTADARSAMLPVVGITAPSEATVVTTAAVTVTGTASDDGPVSVAVNGHDATIAADGTWSVAVPLAPGTNTVTATATDADANIVSAQRTVILAVPLPIAVGSQPPKPPSPPRRVPSNQFALSAANAKDRKSVKLTLRLPGAGAIRATVKRTARTGTLATGRKTARNAGKVTLTLRLSKTALKVLRRSHSLKAQLSVTFTPIGGTARTKTLRLTLRAPRGR